MSMIAEHIPAEVFSLAEFLAEEIEARGWQTQDVAIRMGETDAEEIGKDLLILDVYMVCFDRGATLTGMFDKLSRAFDVSADYLRNIEEGWLKYPDRRSPFKCPEKLFGYVSRRAVIHAVK